MGGVTVEGELDSPSGMAALGEIRIRSLTRSEFSQLIRVLSKYPKGGLSAVVEEALRISRMYPQQYVTAPQPETDPFRESREFDDAAVERAMTAPPKVFSGMRPRDASRGPAPDGRPWPIWRDSTDESRLLSIARREAAVHSVEVKS